MSNWIKNPAGMVVHGCSLESPIERQHSYLTPNDQFFVCSSGTTPEIKTDDYALRIHGDAVAGEVMLSYDDLLAMPPRTVPAVLECAGNQRALFRDVMGAQLRPLATELMWSMGAVGMAEWSGVPLRDVLELAGIAEAAVQVCPTGSEIDSSEGEIRIPIPVSKALDADTLLATHMNGVTLPPDHGFPARVVVPGWVGAYSVKWVQEIEVTSEPIWVRRNTESYVLIGDEWPSANHAPALGAPITEHNIKSSLALQTPATLPAGEHQINGFARSGGHFIDGVLWSEDRGRSWHNATLGDENEKYGWVQFHFQWTAEPGQRVLMTKATDRSGRSQPATIPLNTGGYLYNATHPHPVTVI